MPRRMKFWKNILRKANDSFPVWQANVYENLSGSGFSRRNSSTLAKLLINSESRRRLTNKNVETPFRRKESERVAAEKERKGNMKIFTWSLSKANYVTYQNIMFCQKTLQIFVTYCVPKKHKKFFFHSLKTRCLSRSTKEYLAEILNIFNTALFFPSCRKINPTWIFHQMKFW